MYITINSEFKPFTYDELTKPLRDYTEAYNAVEAQYANLAQQTEAWKNIATQENSPKAYAMYKKYSDELNAVVEDFSRGMTIQNRSKLSGLKSRYASEITPIATAANRLKELVDERAKEELRNPSLRYERAVEDINIDKLIENPFLNYGKSYSGADLEKMVATGAAALQKKITEDPEGWKSILGGQYMQRKLQQGYSIDEVMMASIGDPNAPVELTKLLTSVLDNSGIYDWEGMYDKDGNLTSKGASVINEARAFASRGLYNAVGETKYKELSNKAYDYAIQEQAAKNTEASNTGLYYRAVPKTTVDGDKKTIQMNEDLALLQEILKNPSLMGKKETKKVASVEYDYADIGLLKSAPKRVESEQTYYPYQEKLKKLGKRYNLNYTITDGVLSGGNLEDVAQQISNDIRSSAVRSFSYKPNITQSDLITQVIKENTRSYYRRSNNTGLYELEDNEKGKQIDIKNLNSYFTSDSDIDFDPDLGFIINATDSKGETRSAIIDTELLDDPNRTFSKAQQSIKVALDNGEDELATLLIEATMKAFYDRFNTLERRQNNTTSK